ncbi:ATP-dependent DNA helicase RecQ [Psychromonas sp. SR45-3]|uniref:RecQ family ATP-dependent DNA helicase n=1 Tax=Psychromonas sp. SR45-3 TaxID=2760930 RepID=UPI0015F9F4C6|nr:ATP-dependent DNA helicase RecQ [Psychromonas sp. SR45-3]MBB1274432.1 RecQ family ATP-dependent DNA helicase [Psychromonas sp. SR45-3]
MHASLQQYFGFSQFRPGQEPVIQALLDGHSAAAIFPTGSGKSLCYQLPALHLPHLTLVVSPLLALIQDQLDFLHSKGIAAASIQSMQSPAESAQVYKNVASGEIDILFISVERLNSERFRAFLKKVPISLLVVDEAHCISEWGHNFRPDYLKLASYREEFAIQQVLLLTATATHKVIEDMAAKFDIALTNITLTGSYRPNLDLNVIGVNEEDKLPTLIPWLSTRQQTAGIIYVTLQKTAEQVAQALSQQGIAATAYHAGLGNEQRQGIQQLFMAGKLPLIVATIAFGMGIDKSDIRFVVHYDLPKSIENYAQEIGRAGRDGQRSECLVLANKNNLNVLENFVYADTPEGTAIDFIINEIGQTQGQWEVVMNSLSTQSNIRLLALKTLLVYLELEHVIEPAYSYYAEYKYKLLVPEADLVNRFNGERAQFVQTILATSDKARTWHTLNFEKMQQTYQCERSRVLTAIDYLDQQGLIELQTKQMTQVYKVDKTQISEYLRDELTERFLQKENSEIQRIHHLLAFFASDQCLNLQLATYFSDSNLQKPCGHCSVCDGHPAIMPVVEALTPLQQYNAAKLSAEIAGKLGEHNSKVLQARFFCGLTTPIFTRIKARQLSGFAALERYCFADVLAWIQNQ